MNELTIDYLLIEVSLCLTTGGQIFQKISRQKAQCEPGVFAFLLKILVCRETYYWTCTLCLGAIVWMLVLYRMDVGKAMPFLSLGFVLLVAVSRYKFSEHISLRRWSGVTVIAFGLLLISQS